VYYDTLPLKKERLFYLFTLNTFKKTSQTSFNDLNITTYRLEETDDFSLLPQQAQFLSRIHAISNNESIEDRFRSKYQNVMAMYSEKYPALVEALIASGFSPECVNDEFDWTIYNQET
jgi:hypothetical protein